jgi:hypothetical protein
MAANFINLTDTLEQWRVKANEVYGKVGNLDTLVKTATVEYTGIVGQNADDFTGTHATFTVSRFNGQYSVEVELGGSGYEVGDTVLVDGALLGGSTGTNDATITITAVDPGFAATDATVAGVAVGDLISEVNAIRDELGSLIDYALNTDSQTFYEAINEIEAVLRDGGSGTYALTTDAQDLVAAINEIELSLRGATADYDLDTDADDVVSAINEFQSEIGRVEDFDATGTSTDSRVSYVNLGSTIVSAINALKDKADLTADEMGGIMASDYDGPDTNMMDALNTLYNRSDLGTLDNVYLRRNGAVDMTGLLELSDEGISSQANNFLIKTGASDITAVTINASNQNVGIGGLPGTHKVKVTGAINATTGLYWNGDSTDTRYLRTDTGTDNLVTIDTTFEGPLNLAPAPGNSLAIAGSIVANDDYEFLEWVQDQIGGMFTGNDETGGISAVYNDSTAKITLAVANNSHNHVHTNISDWTEAVQDTVGNMISGNTENGITVVYDDGTGKLNLDVDRYYKAQVTDTDSGYSWSSTGTATGGEYNDTLVFVDGGGIDIDIDATNDAIRIQHTDTSSQASVDNSNGNVIQDISLDTYGHITTIGSVDLDLRYSRTAFKTISIDTTDGDRTWHDSGTNVVADNRDDTLYFVESSSIDIDTDDGGDGIRWQVKDEYIEDVVGAMISSNTEAGVSVTYDDTNGKLNFNVIDPTITFAGGDVTGSFTMTNLGSVNDIELTVANDSHTHDGRYYTETESDNRFVRYRGDGSEGSGFVDGEAFVFNGASSTNIDHIWYDDSSLGSYLGVYHFVADGEYKGTANAAVKAGRFYGDLTGDVIGDVTGDLSGNATTSSSCSGNAATATQVYVTETDSNTNYAICGVVKGDNQNGNESVYADNAIYFNASTNTMVCTNFSGTATKAKYADLAEKYLADAEYPIGTVMAVGGEAEITAANEDNAHSVLGVVSGKPAYLMNSELEGGTTVALKGRVPVNIVGSVKKGDRLAPSNMAGFAQVDNSKQAWSFAIALEDSDSGVVEAVIM